MGGGILARDDAPYRILIFNSRPHRILYSISRGCFRRLAYWTRPRMMGVGTRFQGRLRIQMLYCPCQAISAFALSTATGLAAPRSRISAEPGFSEIMPHADARSAPRR